MTTTTMMMRMKAVDRHCVNMVDVEGWKSAFTGWSDYHRSDHKSDDRILLGFGGGEPFVGLPFVL